jgi:hypothetical protein
MGLQCNQSSGDTGVDCRADARNLAALRKIASLSALLGRRFALEVLLHSPMMARQNLLAMGRASPRLRTDQRAGDGSFGGVCRVGIASADPDQLRLSQCFKRCGWQGLFLE